MDKLGQDAKGADIVAGARVYVACLGRSPFSSGVVVRSSYHNTVKHGEPWVDVDHHDGSRMAWPAGGLIRDEAPAVVVDMLA